MTIDELPTELLISIFKRTTLNEIHRVGYWKECLKIMAVCQRWRCISLPLVHRCASVNYRGRLVTNLDIMTQNMKRHCPRKMSIWMRCRDKDLISGLQGVLEKLQANKIALGKITYLDIDVYFSGLSVGSHDSYMKKSGSIQKVAGALTTLLPDISTLVSNFRTADVIGLELETSLLNYYAGQLKTAKVNSVALVTDMEFDNQLSTFDLRWVSGFGIHAEINASCLTRLVLSDIDESYNFNMFSSQKAKDTSVIRFPVLQYMQVSVGLTTAAMDDGRLVFVGPNTKLSCTLDTPELQCLEIQILCPLTFSLLASIKTPKKLENLRIRTIDFIDFTFHGISLTSATKHIFEKHYKSSSADGVIDDIGLANDLHSINNLVQYGTHAHIRQPIFISDVQNIWWPQVTRLCINMPISLLHALLLVGFRLPDLVSLDVANIKVKTLKDGSQVLADIEDACEITPDSKQSKKLTSINYGFDVSQPVFRRELCKTFEDLVSSMFGSLKDIHHHSR